MSPAPNRARHQSIGNIPHLTPTPVESNPRSRTRHPRAIRDARDPRWIPARAIANVPRAARARSRTSPPARARSIANNARIPSRAPNPILSHRIASRVASHHAPWLAREVRRVTPLGARRVDDDDLHDDLDDDRGRSTTAVAGRGSCTLLWRSSTCAARTLLYTTICVLTTTTCTSSSTRTIIHT